MNGYRDPYNNLSPKTYEGTFIQKAFFLEKFGRVGISHHHNYYHNIIIISNQSQSLIRVITPTDQIL